MRLNLLGTVNLELGGVIKPLTLNRPLWLAVYLAYRDDWVSRQELINLFEPDKDEHTARINLRTLLHRAKQADWVDFANQGDQVRLSVDSDVRHFFQDVNNLALYRGEFLAGATPPIGLEDWCETERTNLKNIWLERALSQARRFKKVGENEQSSALLERVLNLEPLSEEALQLYLQIALERRTRDLARALSFFERFSSLLKRELGLSPLAETIELVEALRIGQKLNKPLQPASEQTFFSKDSFVGRQEELRKVATATGPILIIGPAGIGKTSLVKQLYPQAIWLKCHQELSQLPYFPLVEALRPRLNELQKLSALHRRELARLLPEVFPEAPVDDPVSEIRLLEALTKACELLAEIIVIDDLQWADSGTKTFSAYLFAQQKKLIACWRNDEATAPKLAATVIELGPLSSDDLALLAKENHSDLSGMELFAKSAGNPFFAKEIMQSNETLPKAISELIQNRFAKLSAATQRILQIASVLGLKQNANQLHELAKLSNLSDERVTRALAEAKKAGFWQEGFAHDLQRQTIEQSLTKQVSALFYARAAKNLKLEPSQAAEYWQKANELQKAAQMWQKAALEMTERGFYNQAIDFWQNAWQLTNNSQEKNKISLEIAICYTIIGQFSQAYQSYQKVKRFSSSSSTKYKSLYVESQWFIYQGKLKKAEVLVNEMANLFSKVQKPKEKFMLLITQANFLLRNGKFAMVVDLIKQNLPNYQPSKWIDNLSLARIYATLANQLASALIMLDRHSEAIYYLNRVIKASEISGNNYLKRMAMATLSIRLSLLGHLDKSIMIAEDALKLDENQEDHFSMNLHGLLANAYLKKGSFAQALPHAEFISTANDQNLKILGYTFLGIINHYYGNNTQSIVFFDQAISNLADFENPATKMVVYSNVLQYGSPKQIKEIISLAKSLDPTTITKSSWDQLQALIRNATGK